MTSFRLLLLAFVWLTLMDGLCCSEETGDTLNYIHNFHISGLQDFCKRRTYVVFYFSLEDCFTQTCIKRDIRFRQISLKFVKKEIIFVKVPVSSVYQVKQHMNFQINSLPHFGMSSFEWKKQFPGNDTPHLKTWITEVFEAAPTAINSLEEVSPHDQHYFVYFDKSDLDMSDFDVLMLSKLIHPLSLYFGAKGQVEDTTYQKIREGQQGKLLTAFRSYGEFVLPLDHQGEIHEIANRILENEFPQHCDLNLKSMKYIVHFRLPTFIYFDFEPKQKPFFETFTMLAKKYRKYMMFCVQDLSLILPEESRDIRFYVNVLAGGVPRKVKHGFIRIVNKAEKLKRFRVKGKLNKATAEFLVDNYLHDNLNEYHSSESLGEKNFLKLATGIRKINSVKMEEILTHRVTTHLVYVYSSQTKSLASDINTLMTMAKAIEANKRFSISILNHDRNDIDGEVHEDLPYLFLSNKVFQRKAFEGEINFTNLLKFLAQFVSWLKLKESFLEELRDVHGINLINEDL